MHTTGFMIVWSELLLCRSDQTFLFKCKMKFKFIPTTFLSSTDSYISEYLILIKLVPLFTTEICLQGKMAMILWSQWEILSVSKNWLWYWKLSVNGIADKNNNVRLEVLNIITGRPIRLILILDIRLFYIYTFKNIKLRETANFIDIHLLCISPVFSTTFHIGMCFTKHILLTFGNFSKKKLQTYIFYKSISSYK